MTRFRLRAATPDDLGLAFEITEDAMRQYVEQTWGAWEPAEQLQKHTSNYTPLTHEFVLVNDEIAGLVAVEEEPDYLWLVKLYLLARHRGQGLGTALLSDVQQRARARGKRVRLRVLRVNAGARRFYERHGFRVVQESPERLFMECAMLAEGGVCNP
jgi:GNAT superfamily N-acetyltransferase